ncbi:hypothetical protein GGI08_000857 [Coemansia sp. S2]|nr:hypothetical protein GGI08_000857 [Coemansia sp. S2]KAJ2073732.1 hypothetical protein GGH13_001800 [Coemansia sp. S155-1]KAJ2104766.1 hypothetical protein GGI16_002637 [Coemansia sp. S142-1]KAJ2420344.1 hypothetical protein GGF41_004291 [Coemansia sp. RSA 2531]
MFRGLRVTNDNDECGGIVKPLTQLSLNESGQRARQRKRRNTRVRPRKRFAPYNRPRPQERRRAGALPGPSVLSGQDPLLQALLSELHRESILVGALISQGKTVSEIDEYFSGFTKHKRSFYNSGWKRWATWCVANRRDPVVINDAELAAYLLESGLSQKHKNHIRKSVRSVWSGAGVNPPTTDMEI